MADKEGIALKFAADVLQETVKHMSSSATLKSAEAELEYLMQIQAMRPRLLDRIREIHLPTQKEALQKNLECTI